MKRLCHDKIHPSLHFNLMFLIVHINTILPSTSRCRKGSLAQDFSVQISNASLFLVVCYCKLRRVGGPGDVLETRSKCAWKHCPEDLNGNLCAVWAVAPSCWNLSKSCWRGCNSLRRNFCGTTLYRSALTVTVRLSAFLKEIRTNNAMIIKITPHLWLLHYAVDVGTASVV